MSYRPKHPLIVVVNADGSGYMLQFSTLAEAKTAYASITTDGVAYLYSSSKNSLSSGDGYEAIPEYNNGMTYGTGALVSLNGTVYRLINFIGAGGYGPITHPYAWTTNVLIPPALPPISSTGSTDGARRGGTFTTAQNISFTPADCPSAGTILEEANISPIVIPISGQQIEVGTTIYNLVADGACDSYEVTTSVEYVPNGTLVASDESNSYFSNGEGGYYAEPALVCPSEGAIISEQQAVESTVEICGITVSLGSADYATYADGNCGTYTSATSTNFIPSGTNVGTCAELDYFSDGNGGFYTEDNGSGDGGDGDQCEDPALHGGESGWSYDGCYWSYDGGTCTPAGEFDHFETFYNPTIPVNDCTVTEIVFASSANLDFYTDGNCGIYTDNIWYGIVDEIPDETEVGGYDDGNCGDWCWVTYRSTGSGMSATGQPSYTYMNGSNDDGNCSPSCDPAGTQVDAGSSEVNETLSPSCGTWMIGTTFYDTYADGDCGTYTVESTNWIPNETLLGNCEDYNYYSDGTGGIYQGEYTGP